MKDKAKRTRRLVLLIAVLVLLIFAAWYGAWSYLIRQSHTPTAQFDPGTWVRLEPEGIVSANGEPVYTEMRIGSENKVIVFFYGGGLSVNGFTAAHPFFGTAFVSDENGFYTKNIDGMIPDYLELGIGSSQSANPFRDWTILVIPYCTADFHIGTADYEYTDLDGSKQVLHHHGYTNYRAIMDAASEFLDSGPEELLITGYSAGGFGAALLAEDLMENYFPDAGHVTVCIDSSLLIWDEFGETAQNVWGAPEELCRKFRTDNPIVDLLGELYETYGDSVTYLFLSSVRDGELARFQNFFYTGYFTVSNANGMMYTVDLRQTVTQLRRTVPTIGIYLFDNLPFSLRPYQLFLTQHTVLITPMAFWTVTDRITPARWVYDAVNGRVTNHGLALIR